MLSVVLLSACTGDDPHAALIVTVEGDDPFARTLAFTVEPPGRAWATCAAEGDPAELHLVESNGEASAHELTVRGTLADTDYTCEVHAGDAVTTAAFTTGRADELPVFSVETDGARSISGAYTLFNTQTGCFSEPVWLIVVDPEGRPRWRAEVGDYIADIDCNLIDAETVHYGGGWGLMNDAAPHRGIFRDIDLDGNVLLERSVPDFGLGFNHHSEALPDGTYLSLVGHLDTDGDRDWHGVGIELWDPEHGLVWTWDSQDLYDEGRLFTPGATDENLPYHANAVSLVTDALGPAAWVSNFGMQAIWRIDRATGAVTHVFGVDGDFALTDASGMPLGDDGFPSVQHGVDYQEDRLLAYDNGQNRGQSRVVEYRVDLEATQAELLWEWTEPGWYDPILGDADYLPNGHVLVTQGFSACFTPWSSDRSEIVELLPPATVVWRLRWPSSEGSVYRSERYDGCDVFANARYCPAVADRIAELAR